MAGEIQPKLKESLEHSALVEKPPPPPAFLLGNQRNEVPTVETASNETLERSLG